MFISSNMRGNISLLDVYCGAVMIEVCLWSKKISDSLGFRAANRLRIDGSCLLWVMSTEISVDIAVDIAVDTRSIVGRHSVDSRSILGRGPDRRSLFAFETAWEVFYFLDSGSRDCDIIFRDIYSAIERHDLVFCFLGCVVKFQEREANSQRSCWKARARILSWQLSLSTFSSFLVFFFFPSYF